MSFKIKNTGIRTRTGLHGNRNGCWISWSIRTCVGDGDLIRGRGWTARKCNNTSFFMLCCRKCCSPGIWLYCKTPFAALANSRTMQVGIKHIYRMNNSVCNVAAARTWSLVWRLGRVFVLDTEYSIGTGSISFLQEVKNKLNKASTGMNDLNNFFMMIFLSLNDWLRKYINKAHKLLPRILKYMPALHAMAYLRKIKFINIRHGELALNFSELTET